MKSSQQIRDEHGDGSTAVSSDFHAEALAGMAAEFAASHEPHGRGRAPGYRWPRSMS
ncbi:hypothetical protein [Kitasatospora sp. GP82]|uniref:hypothetical protein n=1 Tax=Kitasatospora sp. GP82 TaxID=3035089 RepID=UPI0024769CD6|nr:hypothetical protein [Kitasatospora sp. GP82]MDH6127575.1 hypothetical protein [Kitasatospora sp. GP82]